MDKEFKVGEVVFVEKGYRNSVRIGETAKVLRKGVAAYWIKFDDGFEAVWKTSWLKRFGGENGIRGRESSNDDGRKV